MDRITVVGVGKVIAAGFMIVVMLAAPSGARVPTSAGPKESSACARIQDFYDDSQTATGPDELRPHLEAAQRQARRSGNARLERRLRQALTAFAVIEKAVNSSAGPTINEAWRSAALRFDAYLTLAAVECRRRGVLVEPLD